MGQAWGFGRYGGPEVQEFFDRPDPVPGSGEVLIRVEVAGVNPLDHMLRSGLVSGLDGGRPFPRVLGMEAAGTVLALGEGIDGFDVGDAVFGFALTGGGTYAETTVLSASNTARIPAGLSATVAATLPVAGTTAVDALDQLDLPAGAAVLVNGVGGGVGLAVARLAVGRELRVIGTGSAAKREHAEAIGVRFIDYTAGDVVATARELVADGFDGIVDLVGGTSLRTVAPLAREARNVIAVGDVSVPELGGRIVERRLDRENLERSARLALDGVLAPVINAVHPLSDAPAALATVENGHASGKVVIKVA
ncbi:NADP-dependent oxidoreductase [Actinoalloteichus hymeniacidonis]|uniref:Zn-dependent oxidoreductase, NADPH:quinone reductase n=1 Tax=Actinoalloteichus hymeniacidonis TaxID=340345 RepID=A0AAC9MVK6_9PSEU|nr:NADP-dependent oxidoreductase [Actinoalloteichus hymeniacidonis]AOS61288.1 Zn-dependent oxidoreductase, NADPH:quinone reductase [Actinoalloteichus hymeniacidonis]MBB5910708.1 NADPH:quinone reductase-like Zn-dependent oxidoreductase [Actinoalloteichus hymeniacidonis]